MLASLCALAWHTALRPGLVGRYYAGGAWSGTPTLVVVDDGVSTDTVVARLATFDDLPQSVSWDGFIHLVAAGSHTFTVTSTGAAWLFLDDRLLVDNGGSHETLTVSATTRAAAGLHAFEVRYLSAGGDPTLELTTGFDGEAPTPIARSALFPSPIAYAIRRAVTLEGYLLPLLWSLVLVGLLAWRPLAHLRRHCAARRFEPRVNLALYGLLTLSLVLNVCGVWWGLPQFWSWAPDELLPRDVLEGLQESFSGGWSTIYPPVHYYLLGFIFLPFHVAGRLGLTDVWADHSYLALYLLARSVSVLMAVGTVYVVYLCSLELGKSRLAGLCGAILVALMPPFVFYGKLANVDIPYLCWFALSILFYIRAVRTDERRAYWWFAVTGMLAVCTKDQAYGFYVLPAVHLIWRRYRSTTGAGWARVQGFAADRRLWLSFGGAVLVFVVGHNLLFNAAGFVDHVGIITGDASQDYQMWDRSLAGHLAMAGQAVVQLSWMLGWPAFVVCVAGVMSQGARGDRFLLLPALSYYVFFISVVMYHFDRFFLGVGLLLALYGGPLIASQLESLTRVGWRRLGVAALLLYGLCNGALVDVMMVNDARYYVERWLRRPDHLNASVRMAGFDIYLPRFDELRTAEISRYWPDVVEAQPRFIVMNRGFSCRAIPDSEEEEFYARLANPANGYRRVVAHRYQTPWPPVGEARLWRAVCPDGFSNLAMINPEIQVFGRVDP